MKKRDLILKPLVMLALILSCVAPSFAAGEKERMMQRAGEIRTLKTAGVIGEKADGLLGVVKADPAGKAVVSAENADRNAVYAAIAKSQGVAVAKVAARRASQLMGQAVAGDWLQASDGTWSQK